MGKEHAFWNVVRKALRGTCDLQRIENVVVRGMPDVNVCVRACGCEAWIELKDIERWPKKPDTPVLHRDHYTLDQAFWLHERWLLAKNTFLFLRVRSDDTHKPRIGFVSGEHARLVFNAPLATWRPYFRSTAVGTFPLTQFLESLPHGHG